MGIKSNLDKYVWPETKIKLYQALYKLTSEPNVKFFIFMFIVVFWGPVWLKSPFLYKVRKKNVNTSAPMFLNDSVQPGFTSPENIFKLLLSVFVFVYGCWLVLLIETF